MKIRWLGHASFLITSEKGISVLTDPYAVGGGIGYGKIQESADIVTISHQHGDHNNYAAVKGNPQIVEGPGRKVVKGIEFQGISAYHDEAKGGQRGANSIFCFTMDGIRICHLGDLGHPLSEKQAQEIGGIDILLIPVGGFYTIDAIIATQVCALLKPKAVIPMHYKTAKCAYPISGVEDFLKDRKNVRKLESSEVEWKREQLPSIPETVVLKHAL